MCDETGDVCGIVQAVLTVENTATQPGMTAQVIVSGDVAGESTYGVSILVEIVPRGGNAGTVTFTPATGPADVDIVQLVDPWPGSGNWPGRGANPSTAAGGSRSCSATGWPESGTVTSPSWP